MAAQAGETMYPVVHIDGIRQTEIEVLTSLPAREVGEIEYLPGREATTRFGTGYSNGAILVRTRR
ncbi:MAG: hypothetical protein GWO22_19955 [Actinobacteria bacterium]|nr:hypothetical protein [Actinomycetota bacterium]